MGKTKLTVVGEELPQKDKKRQEKSEAKKAAKKQEKEAQKASEQSEDLKTEYDTGKKVSKQQKKSKKKHTSPRYLESKKEIDSKTSYPLETAVKILKKFKSPKFDETLELHINTKERGVSGTLDLPHGSGKKRKIQIADDQILKDIEGGKIDFDVLIATPDMMPKLAKVARILGPRGLMPNPKSGTVTESPKKVADKLNSGQVNYKTEPKAPLIHITLGKASYTEKQILENLNFALNEIGLTHITAASLTSTMNPAIKLDISALKTKKN